MDDFCVPIEGMWSAVAPRRRVVDEELPAAGSEPLSRAERIAYTRLIGEQWAYERDACDAHLMDLWREYPLGIPQ